MEIVPPYPPMEALLVEEIPRGSEWQYEPKWDGFRCIAFRTRKTMVLQSKAGQRLDRYFPEIVASLVDLQPGRFVLDGEIVVPEGRSTSFDALLQRIHPAESRVRRLAQEHPAAFIVFDLLVDERGRSVANKPLHERRRLLEAFAKRYFPEGGRVHLSPATTEFAAAKRWFRMAGGTLDGIVAKRRDLAYPSGERVGMQKVKRIRTADCVVGGFRYASKGALVGSLLLGLYDGDGLLHHVGFTSGFATEDRKTLTRKLESLIAPPGFTGRAPGGPSRWSTKRSADWQPLAPKLVAEVRYDHFTGARFRHGTRFLRWRPDKKPRQCKMSQISSEAGVSAMGLL